MLFATDQNTTLASVVIAAIGMAVGGLITVIVGAMNSARESRSKTKLAEDQAEAAKRKTEMDDLWEKSKELLAKAIEQAEKVGKEAAEIRQKHHDCEIRLAKTEERIALLERKENERSRGGVEGGS